MINTSQCVHDCQSRNRRFPFFPVPEQGETVYSLFCRAVERTGLPAKYILESLTGQARQASLRGALPGNVVTISESLPEGHPWTDKNVLIEAHSSFPYYTYFDSPEQRAIAKQLVTETNSCINASMSLGLAFYRQKVSLAHHRFCLDCLREDQKEYGFSIFHREHQLPGVALCWKHGGVLFGGCSICNRKAGRYHGMFMAGRCKCLNNISPSQAFADIPADLKLLKWIADQSAYMVHSEGTSCESSRVALRQLYLRSAYAKGSLLDYSKIANEIERRYGSEFLAWLGYPAWKNGRASPWITRFLSIHKSNSRSPAIIYLLFIGLICDSLNEFEQLVKDSAFDHLGCEKANQPVDSTSQVGEDEYAKGSSLIVGSSLTNLLQENSHRLSVVASKLGISIYALAKEVRGQGIRVPLSSATINKHSNEKIDTVRAELRSGVPKNEIKTEHRVSDWTILLIELDELDINLVHKNASKENARESHRRVVLNLIANNPTASKMDLMRTHSGSYEFMLEKDKEWFDMQFANRPPKSNPSKIDRTLKERPDGLVASRVAKVIEAMLSPEHKPRRITATGVLKLVGCLNQYATHREQFVQTDMVLNQFIETQETFLKRKIRWAIVKMQHDGNAISINRLRRVAGVPASKLRERKQYVIETATALGAVVGGRSFFKD